MKESKYSWETIVIAVSFVAVWIYFGLQVWGNRTETPISPIWQLLLLPALVLLLVIFARRLKRVFDAMGDAMDRAGRPPGSTPPKK